MYKIYNNIEDKIIFQGNDVELIEFAQLIAKENEDFEFLFDDVSDAKKYIIAFCDNLKLLKKTDMNNELPYTKKEIDNLTRGELVEFILDEAGDEFESKNDIIQLAVSSLSGLKQRAKDVLGYIAQQIEEENKPKKFTIPVVRIGYAFDILSVLKHRRFWVAYAKISQ